MHCGPVSNKVKDVHILRSSNFMSKNIPLRNLSTRAQRDMPKIVHSSIVCIDEKLEINYMSTNERIGKLWHTIQQLKWIIATWVNMNKSVKSWVKKMQVEEW